MTRSWTGHHLSGACYFVLLQGWGLVIKATLCDLYNGAMLWCNAAMCLCYTLQALLELWHHMASPQGDLFRGFGAARRPPVTSTMALCYGAMLQCVLCYTLKALVELRRCVASCDQD
jgi:hypothetical protein